MLTPSNEEFANYGEQFLAQYPRNPQGGIDGADEDLDTLQRIGYFLREVEEGEARMLQESALMRFEG